MSVYYRGTTTIYHRWSAERKILIKFSHFFPVNWKFFSILFLWFVLKIWNDLSYLFNKLRTCKPFINTLIPLWTYAWKDMRKFPRKLFRPLSLDHFIFKSIITVQWNSYGRIAFLFSVPHPLPWADLVYLGPHICHSLHFKMGARNQRTLVFWKGIFPKKM